MADRMAVEDAWYSVRDVSERFGVEVRTVRKWIKSGELAALFVGGRVGYKISETSIEEYVERKQMKVLARREFADV